MQKMVTNWLKYQIDIDHARKGKAERFALHITCKVIFVACIVNASVHCALDCVGVLPYPLQKALIVGDPPPLKWSALRYGF